MGLWAMSVLSSIKGAHQKRQKFSDRAGFTNIKKFGHLCLSCINFEVNKVVSELELFNLIIILILFSTQGVALTADTAAVQREISNAGAQQVLANLPPSAAQ